MEWAASRAAAVINRPGVQPLGRNQGRTSSPYRLGKGHLAPAAVLPFWSPIKLRRKPHGLSASPGSSPI